MNERFRPEQTLREAKQKEREEKRAAARTERQKKWRRKSEQSCFGRRRTLAVVEKDGKRRSRSEGRVAGSRTWGKRGDLGGLHACWRVRAGH